MGHSSKNSKEQNSETNEDNGRLGSWGSKRQHKTHKKLNYSLAKDLATFCLCKEEQISVQKQWTNLVEEVLRKHIAVRLWHSHCSGSYPGLQ